MFSRKIISYDGDEIIDESEIDVTWNQIRTHRDVALSATDWRAVKDRTMSAAWKAYRQALRDLPQNFFDESDEVSQGANTAADNWPQPPE